MGTLNESDLSRIVSSHSNNCVCLTVGESAKVDVMMCDKALHLVHSIHTGTNFSTSGLLNNCSDSCTRYDFSLFST